ncbi:MAG: acyl-CoA thioester hydrolase/BAAT C-terminal domain-containing protein [Pseudomonadota bacterium]
MAHLSIHDHAAPSGPSSVPTISLTGHAPAAAVRLEQSFLDDAGTLWRSQAQMYADVFGALSSATSASQGGTYHGVDALGLCWSMQPSDITPDMSLDDKYRRRPGIQPVFKDPHRPYDIDVKAFSGDTEIAQGRYVRQQISPDVDVVPVSDNGLRGFFYAPKSPSTREGVIAISGSGGGYDWYWARHLASLGIPVLNLAYFQVPGLPDTLTRIPLEYFKAAIDWLKHKTSADRVGIQGVSRGGEAVLLIGSTFAEDIACIVAQVPIHVKTGGFIPGTQTQVAAWTLDGKDLSFANTPVPTPETCEQQGTDMSRGMPVAPFYLNNITNAEHDDDVWIPIEHAQAPMLLITGEDDAIWPCSHAASRVIERLKKYHSNAQAEHLTFPGAGHILPPTGTITSLTTSMYHQHARLLIAVGGTPAVNAHAGAKAWARNTDFLLEHLKAAW